MTLPKTKAWQPTKAAGKSETTSDEQVGLPWALVSQVVLVLAHGEIAGYFPSRLVALPRQLRNQL